MIGMLNVKDKMAPKNILFFLKELVKKPESYESWGQNLKGGKKPPISYVIWSHHIDMIMIILVASILDKYKIVSCVSLAAYPLSMSAICAYQFVSLISGTVSGK